jgi:anti-sigma regulatory factor (Ser/Thr protein kinase)
MFRYHMVVVTADTALKRAVKRLTTATGASADFVTDANGIAPDLRVNLAIVDARGGDPPAALLKAIPPSARIVFIIQGDSLVSKLHLVGDPRVTSLFCYDAQFDDDEFISSATKALRGEVFGLQKYFPWGVTTFAMKVTNYEEKGRAIETLLEYATLAGCRGPVRDRIQLVCDELMMNALYHAPLDENGQELYAGRTLKELAHLERVSPIQVQYGCSGRYFGVSVRDSGGSLARTKLLEYLLKAKSAVREIETKSLGAGLGLVSTLRSVSKLVFNVEVRSSTEVIALFDMELFAKGTIGARSLHVFDVPRKQERHDDEGDQTVRTRRVGGFAMSQNVYLYAIAAILLLVAGAMGIMLLSQRGHVETPAPQSRP